MIFDVGDENVGSILLGGEARGDAGAVARAALHDVLDASGGVVEGDGLDVGMGAQPAAALREGDGVGQDPGDVGERDAGLGDDVMLDGKQRLARDAGVVLEQEVVVLEDTAVKAVLDGQDGERGGACFEAIEDVGGEGAGEDLAGCLVEHEQRGHVAVGAEFALDGDAGCAIGVG